MQKGMVYTLDMIGTYIGAVVVNKETVLVTQKCFVEVKVEAKSAMDAVNKVYETSDNAESIRKIEPVDGTLQLSPNAEKHASKEAVQIVRDSIHHIECPEGMFLAKHSLVIDPINTLMH